MVQGFQNQTTQLLTDEADGSRTGRTTMNPVNGAWAPSPTASPRSSSSRIGSKPAPVRVCGQAIKKLGQGPLRGALPSPRLAACRRQCRNRGGVRRPALCLLHALRGNSTAQPTFFLGGGFYRVPSVRSYPFLGHRTIGWALTLIFIALGVPVVIAFAQMDKDANVSRLADTQPGKLDSAFYTRLVSYGALPLLTVMASQFPASGRLCSPGYSLPSRRCTKEPSFLNGMKNESH